MKEYTKKGQNLKFHPNQSMRTLSTMRTFVKLVLEKNAASWWLLSLRAKRFTRCSCEKDSSGKPNSLYNLIFLYKIYSAAHRWKALDMKNLNTGICVILFLMIKIHIKIIDNSMFVSHG